MAEFPSWILPLATTLFGGVPLGVWLKHQIDTRKLRFEERKEDRSQDRVDFDLILKEVKAQRDEAWAHIKGQDQRIEAMEAEIQGLRLARDLDPFPNWVVDLQGKYIFVNREFEKVFLEPDGRNYRSVIGQSHADLWPASFCETLRLLDSRAKSTPDGKARAATIVDLAHHGRMHVTVHKFPIRFKGVIVAFAGFITDLESEDERIAA